MNKILTENIFSIQNGQFHTNLKILAHVIKPDMQIYFLDTSPLNCTPYVLAIIFRNNELNLENYICLFWKKDKISPSQKIIRKF